MQALILRSLVFCSLWQAQASESQPGVKDDDAGKARIRAFQKRARELAAEYQIYSGADRKKKKLSLRTDPVLHWTNPVDGSVYGSTFIWTAMGRPEVIASFHRWHTKAGAIGEEHELNSLALSDLYAERGGQPVWYPPKPGVELKPIPDAPLPAESASQRLQQMRALAYGFAAFIGPETDRSVLRLLTQPIHRYESTDPTLLDGALFAFVRATDPEVLLLIEARKQQEGFAWHYALARQSARYLQVLYNDREVCNFPPCWDRVRHQRQDPYVAFLEPFVPE